MNNVIGPIDRKRWNLLRFYRSYIKYHNDNDNDKAVSMAKPIYKEALDQIRKVS